MPTDEESPCSLPPRLPAKLPASGDATISSESLADGPASHGAVLAGGECVQLVRLRVDSPVRDHLPTPVPRLLNGDRRFGACRDPGRRHPRNTSLGRSARSLSP